MVSVICYRCYLACDIPDESEAVQQAHKHARDYGHNVGVYASESLAEGQKRELRAFVLKSRPVAA